MPSNQVWVDMPTAVRNRVNLGLFAEFDLTELLAVTQAFFSSRPLFYPLMCYQTEAAVPGAWPQSPAPSPWLHPGLLHPLPSSPSPPLLSCSDDFNSYRLGTDGSCQSMKYFIFLVLGVYNIMLRLLISVLCFQKDILFC
jgi:hypothetical protein